MKASDLKVLERLAQDPGVKGRKHLQKVIWFNTCKPKYKEDDCYCVTDQSLRIWGIPVRDFHARIDKVVLHHDGIKGSITYEAIAHVLDKSTQKERDVTIYVREDAVGKKVRDNENVINGTSKYAESVDVYL